MINFTPWLKYHAVEADNHSFLTLTVDEVNGLLHAPAALPGGKSQLHSLDRRLGDPQICSVVWLTDTPGSTYCIVAFDVNLTRKCSDWTVCTCNADKARCKTCCQSERSLVWQVRIRATLRAVVEVRGIATVQNIQGEVVRPSAQPLHRSL